MTEQTDEPEPAAPMEEPPAHPPQFSPDHDMIDYLKKSGQPDDLETRDKS